MVSTSVERGSGFQIHMFIAKSVCMHIIHIPYIYVYIYMRIHVYIYACIECMSIYIHDYIYIYLVIQTL